MEFSQNQIYFFIETMQKNNYIGTQIHGLLETAWGNIISARRVQQIMKEFQEGKRTDHNRQIGSGRPLTSCNEDNVVLIEQLIQEDSRISLSQLVEQTQIDRSAIQRILNESLNLKSISAKWVPYNLNENQKKNRIENCKQLLEQLNKKGAQTKLVVVDEKWVYQNSIQLSQNLRCWVDSDNPKPEKPQQTKRSISDKKWMLIFASNFNGSSYYEILEDGKSINSDTYGEFIKNAVKFFKQEGIKKIWWMHDNARPHISLNTKQILEDQVCRIIKQPAYSPDLNLQDRFTFRNFEIYRKNIYFENQ
ncbi:hypothetical protein ABPG72_019808 [Tetrahymena utriculariae]